MDGKNAAIKIHKQNKNNKFENVMKKNRRLNIYGEILAYLIHLERISLRSTTMETWCCDDTRARTSIGCLFYAK